MHFNFINFSYNYILITNCYYNIVKLDNFIMIIIINQDEIIQAFSFIIIIIINQDNIKEKLFNLNIVVIVNQDYIKKQFNFIIKNKSFHYIYYFNLSYKNYYFINLK